MVIDLQHHYIPVELAKKRGLYSATGRTILQEGGLPATTIHQRLYDLALQLDDMAQAGIDVSVLSCLLGWSAPLEECRFINDDLAAVQKNTRAALSVWPKRQSWTASRRWMSCAARLTISGCAA